MSNLAHTSKGGFTLLEVLIYIALFTIIIGGGIVSALSIFEGTARIDMNTEAEAELNFILRKFSWALSGGDILEPSLVFNDTSNTLRVDKGPTYTFTLNTDGILTMNDGTDTFELTDVLIVDSLQFKSTNGNPDIITIELTIDGEVLEPIQHYVRTD